jgi:hypothetical protein
VGSSASSFTAKNMTFTASSTSITVYVQAYKQQTGDTWADSVSLTQN